jgi:hypothetical protein
MIDEITRYSDADLAEFKEIIQNKIQKAQADLDLIKSVSHMIRAILESQSFHCYFFSCFSFCYLYIYLDFLSISYFFGKIGMEIEVLKQPAGDKFVLF